MFLILAHAGDATATAVHQVLCARYGTRNVTLLTDEALVSRVGWAHALNGRGVGTTLRLPDGRCIAAADIAAVFNRLRYLNPAHFASLAEADRAYAVCETFALLISWLAGLPCPVVNRPDVRSLSGNHRSLIEWLKLAAEAGLPTRAIQFATNARLTSARGFFAFQPLAGTHLAHIDGFVATRTPVLGQRPTLFLEATAPQTESLLVIGDIAYGKLRIFADAARALARRVRAELLECVFVRPVLRDDDEWRCTWINPLPELGAKEVAAVADLLGAAPTATEGSVAVARRGRRLP